MTDMVADRMHFGKGVILDMRTLSASEVAVSCSPRVTAKMDKGVSCPFLTTQWAAVRTCWLEMRVPPQNPPFLMSTNLTIHGYLCSPASEPPTTLLTLFGILAMPQLQPWSIRYQCKITFAKTAKQNQLSLQNYSSLQLLQCKSDFGILYLKEYVSQRTKHTI